MVRRIKMIEGIVYLLMAADIEQLREIHIFIREYLKLNSKQSPANKCQ